MQRSLALLAAAVLGTAACADSNDDLGQIDLTLVGQAASGTVYRLRNAVLTVEGPGGPLTFRTEDDPSRTRIDARVASGAYALHLAPGWHLERVSDGAGQRVAATLLSAAPLPFDVAGGEFTPVVLRFRAGADEVDLGHGDIGISIGVEEPQPQAITATPSSLTVVEGNSATVAVRLAQPITAPVTVRINVGAQLAVSTSTLTFTPANYDVDQRVTVSASHDADTVDATASLILTTGAVTRTIPVTVTDDDIAQRIVTSTAAVDVTERGVRTFTVALGTQPVASTTVTLVVDSPSVATAEPATLTFTPSNWSTAQAVTVRGVAAGAATISLRAGDATASVAVAVRPAAPAQQMIVSTAAVDVTERGAQTFTVALGVQPVASTTVTVTASDVLVATAEPATLTFTPSNWSTAQAVTVRGVSPGQTVVSLHAPGATSASVAVMVRAASVTEVVGWPVDSGQSVDLAANLLALFPVDLSQPATLQSLQIRSAQPSPLARLALYRNAGDRPGELVVASTASPLVAAPQPTVHPVAASLAPGRYWIGVILSGPASLRRGATALVTRCTATVAAGGGFPATAPSSMTCAATQPLAIAATVQR